MWSFGSKSSSTSLYHNEQPVSTSSNASTTGSDNGSSSNPFNFGFLPFTASPSSQASDSARKEEPPLEPLTGPALHSPPFSDQEDDDATSDEEGEPFEVFVGGLRELGDSINEEELLVYFEVFGEVTKLELTRDRRRHDQRGFCFVSYTHKASALACLDHKTHAIRGMPIAVERAMRDASGAKSAAAAAAKKRTRRSRRPGRNKPLGLKPLDLHHTSNALHCPPHLLPGALRCHAPDPFYMMRAPLTSPSAALAPLSARAAGDSSSGSLSGLSRGAGPLSAPGPLGGRAPGHGYGFSSSAAPSPRHHHLPPHHHHHGGSAAATPSCGGGGAMWDAHGAYACGGSTQPATPMSAVVSPLSASSPMWSSSYGPLDGPASCLSSSSSGSLGGGCDECTCGKGGRGGGGGAALHIDAFGRRGSGFDMPEKEFGRRGFDAMAAEKELMMRHHMRMHAAREPSPLSWRSTSYHPPAPSSDSPRSAYGFRPQQDSPTYSSAPPGFGSAAPLSNLSYSAARAGAEAAHHHAQAQRHHLPALLLYPGVIDSGCSYIAGAVQARGEARGGGRVPKLAKGTVE
ncbi:hypothetical protein JKP88DRAFT_330434 [Tribonema minus]|uniref:RRM domain-containing protein n=1 Tax=Tribonema minus TaxID=303371 RepID=A0A835YMM9_9STRA|nr:hypothetical protein JKP88DRAFT_330434 [Tribonema minus]